MNERGPKAVERRCADEGRDADGLCVGLTVVERDDPRRSCLEAFIAARFLRAHGARIDHFADRLVGIAAAGGGWAAGLGFTAASAGPLFVEQYLDRPVQDVIARRLGVGVDRSQIVEVGNLAAEQPGSARRLIVLMTELLHRRGFTWVVLTSTRMLLNSFSRLYASPILLGSADPRRLTDGAARWGRYYDTRPQVLAASIPIGFIRFQARGFDVDQH